MARELEFFEKDTPPDWTKNEWFGFYQTLNGLKHTQEALRAGNAGGEMVRYTTQSPKAYVFSRSKGSSEVLVLVNLSPESVELVYDSIAPAGEYTNLFTGEKEVVPTSLGEWGYCVLVK
ncbi:MAG: hypothetical protein LIP01_13925 [Tannerellaceae bacterium]|nr:hypothetical protein [Tannerellaceae bacterium]